MLTNAIREGSDMYFVCLIEAIPPVKEITWLHNKRPVNETYLKSDHLAAFVGKEEDEEEEEVNNNLKDDNNGSAEGLIISNNSLVLQRVKLEQRGQYACLASNSEGITESNKIELTVLRKLFIININNFYSFLRSFILTFLMSPLRVIVSYLDKNNNNNNNTNRRSHLRCRESSNWWVS